MLSRQWVSKVHFLLDMFISSEIYTVRFFHPSILTYSTQAEVTFSVSNSASPAADAITHEFHHNSVFSVSQVTNYSLFWGQTSVPLKSSDKIFTMNSPMII